MVVGVLLGYEITHRGGTPTVATIDKRKKFLVFVTVICKRVLWKVFGRKPSRLRSVSKLENPRIC
jgi:hypothetical protein